MADEADVTQETESYLLDIGIRNALANQPKPGKPGDCDTCGEWSGRLIDGECAPCRDRHLPVRRM